MNLPDAEQLCTDLIDRVRPAITPDTAVIGIRTGGAWLAERLHAEFALSTPLGILDISFYRDDYHRSGLHNNVQPSRVPFAVDDRPILLVDDVLFTGRTIRAAMNEIFDYGRPARIDLAVLVDRGERQLPISATWSGTSLAVPQGRLLRLVRNDEGQLSLRLSEAKAA